MFLCGFMLTTQRNIRAYFDLVAALTANACVGKEGMMTCVRHGR